MWPLLVSLFGLAIHADGVIDAPISDVHAALVDYAAHPAHLGLLVESTVVDRQVDELWVHQRFRLPLLRDRETTLHVSWEEQRGAIFTRFVVDATRVRKVARQSIAIPWFSGTWRLDPIRDGTATRVRFAAAINFGGGVPLWVARRGLAIAVPRFYASFERLARQEGARRIWSECPSAVTGATTQVVEVAQGVRVLVTADDAKAEREIRRRAHARADAKESGWSDPAEQFASCPGLIPRTVLDATDVPGGVELSVRPFDPSHTERIYRLTRMRARAAAPAICAGTC